MKRFFWAVGLCFTAGIAFSQTMLDSALVIGTQATAKTPLTFTTIGRNAIKSGNVAAEAPYLMMLSPALVNSSESGLGIGNTSFRIRGVDPSRINIMADGVMLNDAESQTVFWANMPDFGSSLSSIQIQRGVGLSSGGVASFGASVNMLTARPKSDAYAELSAEYGSYNTMRASISAGTGLINNAFTFDARYSRILSDGYIERATSNNQSVFASAAYHANKSTLKLNLLYGDQHTGISWNGVPGYMLNTNRRYNAAGLYIDNNGDTAFYDNNTDNYKQTQLNLQYSQQLGCSWVSNVRAYFTRGLGYYEEYKMNRKLASYGIADFSIGSSTIKKSDLIQQKWLDNYYYGLAANTVYSKGRVELSMGLDANRYDGDHYGKLLWLRVNNGVPKDYEWYKNKGVKDDVSGFARLNYELLSKLSLFGDVQLRHVRYTMSGPDDDLALLDQEHRFTFLNPKLGLTYKLSKSHELYTSFASTGREPARADFKDASKNGGAKQPTDERLFDYELGYRFVRNSAMLSANVYYMAYNDQIVATGKMNDVGYPIMENVANSYRMGLEVSGGVGITKQLRLEANVSLNQSRIKDYVSYVDLYDNSTDWNPLGQRAANLGTVSIGFSPKLVGAALLSYSPINNLSVSLIGKYIDSQYYDNTMSRERQLPAYFVSNLQAQYAFAIGASRLTLMASVNNLFNKQYLSSAWVYRSSFASGEADYVEDGFFPQAGTTVFGKVIISF